MEVPTLASAEKLFSVSLVEARCEVEFPTGEGKLYLAGVRDLCHRGLPGWAMDEHQDAELVIDALTMALRRCDPDPDGLVHHSDKGSVVSTRRSTSARPRRRGFADQLRLHRDCFDNAAMETFWSTLKREIAWIRGSIFFATRAEAKLYLFEFIEVFYNRQRNQTRLGYMTPVEHAATFNGH